MSVPSIHNAYRDSYPIAGDVAVLCEGDILGFEVNLIEKLAIDGPLVNVWPCGTQDSIYGLADAIGRARPLIVIEDRDYRTQEQAKADCKRKQKERLDRGVQVRDWRTWIRNEIENYLIEPSVVVPVFAEYFHISDPELVRSRLESVVKCLRVDQAAQFALNQFWYSLPPKRRYIGGLPKKKARPCWNAEQKALAEPDVTQVRTALEKELTEKAERYRSDGKTIDSGEFVRHFEAKCSEWKGVTCSSPIWLVDWAGKDILLSLCRWLAGEFGIFSVSDHQQRLVDWDALAGAKNPDGSKKDEEIERQIIHELRPKLENAFLEQLPSMGGDVQKEWDALMDTIRQAAIR